MSYQKILGHVDSLIPALSSTIVYVDSAPAPNPAYITWLAIDQKALILLQSSLSKEAMAETLYHKTSNTIWSTLEVVYSHDSVERMHTLWYSIRQIKKGSSNVAEFGQKFMSICDQLSAIVHPLDETDKIYWFLHGLGFLFENFSTTRRLIQPHPAFCDLVSQAKSHDIFS